MKHHSSFPFIFLAALMLPVSLWAQTPGSVDAGGGVRGTDEIRVRDGLGIIAAGRASAATVSVQSGAIPGLPAATPVLLRKFSLVPTETGVELTWEAGEAGRIFGFYLERAITDGDDPPDEDFVRVRGRAFPGRGPHTHIDSDVETGRTHFYRLHVMTGIGENELLGPWSVRVEAQGSPFRPVVFSAAPNPFRDATVLHLTLAETATVRWQLTDVRGRAVAGGAMSGLAPGYHTYTIRPRRQLAGGVYFLKVQAGDMVRVQKLVSLP